MTDKKMHETHMHRKDVSVDKLKRYIKSFLAKGYSKSYLKKFLVQQGYDKENVDIAYKEMGLSFGTGNLGEHFSAALDSGKRYITKLPKWSHYLIAAVIVLAIVGILLPTEPAGIKDCGKNRQCFIDAANSCREAVFMQNLEGSVIEYKSGVSDESCVVTKHFSSFAADEPEEIKSLFNGLEMQCSYKKGSFDEKTAENLAGNIENCEGLLKDAIYELRIAQIELGLS